jgi:hypothetical protein
MQKWVFSFGINYKTIYRFSSFNEAKQFKDMVVNKFFDQELDRYSNEIGEILDITKTNTNIKKEVNKDYILSGEGFSGKYSVKEEFKECNLVNLLEAELTLFLKNKVTSN